LPLDIFMSLLDHIIELLYKKFCL